MVADPVAQTLQPKLCAAGRCAQEFAAQMAAAEEAEHAEALRVDTAKAKAALYSFEGFWGFMGFSWGFKVYFFATLRPACM
jgi:3-deoxy-D-arabino-heptulosonate 7-phosphate (DAHP) synthase